MTCPVCHVPIPDGLLACPGCAQRKSREAVLKQQKIYLPLVLDGKIALPICHRGLKHIQLLGDNRHAYCGLELSTTKRQFIQHVQLANVDQLCSECKTAYDACCASLAMEAH